MENKIITRADGKLFNPTLAERAVTFINMLKHTKGEFHGKPFNLIDWQKDIITDVFGTVKANGYRQYNTAYIEIPKKQGKSELAAAVDHTCAETAAPCGLALHDVKVLHHRHRAHAHAVRQVDGDQAVLRAALVAVGDQAILADHVRHAETLVH